jgi:PHD/YefM family antitoxin component YafN of YafNO toxin-antitoxin module
MSEEKPISEPGPVYGTLAIDLSEPLVIERDGKPVAVVLTYEEYTELKATASEKVLRRKQAWQRLDALLAEVHAEPTDLTSEEIEAEITAARQEVREVRHARRSH